MCRSLECGGRRCPENIAARRARQRAYYRRKVEARNKTVQSGFGRPRLPDPAPKPAPLLLPVSLQSRIDAAIDDARWRLGRLADEPAFETSTGWPLATAAGEELDDSLQAVGALVDERVAELFAEREPEMRAELGELAEQWGTREKLEQEVIALRILAGISRGELDATEETLLERAAHSDRGPLFYNRLYRAFTKGAEFDRDDLPDATMRELWDRWERDRDRHADDAAQRDRAEAALKQWDGIEIRHRAAAARAALAEQTELGRGPLGIATDELVDPRISQKPATKALEAAWEFFPSGWLDASGQFEHEDRRGDPVRLPVRARATTTRAHYAHVQRKILNFKGPGGEKMRDLIEHAEVTIDTKESSPLGPGVRIALHEWAHRTERTNPSVNAALQAHIARRTTEGEGANRRRTPLYRYGKGFKGEGEQFRDWSAARIGGGEWVRDGGFANEYFGKTYDEGASELLSMSMESIFAGTNGGLEGHRGAKADLRLRHAVLGLLATA